MTIVKLHRRVHEATVPIISAKPSFNPLWPIKGQMHPNICPAIRNANIKGFLISGLHDIQFYGPNSFDVWINSDSANRVAVVPGIIGSYDSNILFAKVDTGFSVDNLPVEWLSLPVLNIEFSLNLIVPGVIYPKGYSGPLFVAVAARTQVRIPSGYPLAQLVTIDNQEVEVEISETISFSSNDCKFQGLLHPGWRNVERHGKLVKASQCLQLFHEYPENELANLLTDSNISDLSGSSRS